MVNRPLAVANCSLKLAIRRYVHLRDVVVMQRCVTLLGMSVRSEKGLTMLEFKQNVIKNGKIQS